MRTKSQNAIMKPLSRMHSNSFSFYLLKFKKILELSLLDQRIKGVFQLVLFIRRIFSPVTQQLISQHFFSYQG